MKKRRYELESFSIFVELMDWIIYSFIMYFFSVTLYLGLRKLQKDEVSNDINNPAMFFLGWIIFGIMGIVYNESFALSWKIIAMMFVATFLFSYLGNKFSLAAIKASDNPGLSLIIQKSYAIYTAFAAVVLFDAELSTKNLLAICIVILFLILLLKPEKGYKLDRGSLDSIGLSFLAFFAFGNLILFSKYLLNEGVTPIMWSFYIQFFVSIMFSVEFYRNYKKKKEVREQIANSKHYPLLILIGLSNAFFNLAMRYGIQTAPNVGYVNIINTASISAITLFSALLFKDRLSLRKIVGVAGVTVGIALLFI